MKVFKQISFGIAAGVALTALSMPVATDADAGVIAYSTLQVSNVRLTSGGDQIGSIDSINNATSSRASFDDAPGVSFSNASDALMSCVGDCGGIGQNDYSQISAGNPSLHFARGDSILSGTIPAGNAAASTVAETQLTSRAGSNAGGEISSTSFFTTIDFDGVADDVTLEFDAFGELFVSSSDVTGFAQADFNWQLTLFDVTGGTLAGFFLPSDLNQSVAVDGIGSDSYSVNDSFLLTVSGLQADHQYRLIIDHNSDVEAELPVPATLAVLGIGLLGLGALARRRKQIA